MEISVDTGRNPDGTPNGLSLGGRYLTVTEILDRWPGEDHLYLKARAGDGGLYLLRRDDTTHRWQLWMYQADHPTPIEPLSGK